MGEWEIYNRGEANLKFYHRDGTPFNGEMENFFKEHYYITGLRNKTTGTVVLLNHYGEIAARTPTSTPSD